MSTTRAVPLSVLRGASGETATTGRPLCPRCAVGFLHPFRVDIALGETPVGWQGAGALVGWVAVCRGNAEENENTRELYEAAEHDIPETLAEYPPCGFWMSMEPVREDPQVGDLVEQNRM